MGLLTREEVLAAKDRATEDIDVPEWGGAIRIAEFSAYTREAYAERVKGIEAGTVKVSVLAFIVAQCAVDASMLPLFTEEDLKPLGEKHPAVIARLAERCLKLNKIGQEAKEEIKGE